MSRTGMKARRGRRRAAHVAQLSLVSLMDIFTILVFFLLVNASGIEVLPTPRDMALPESTALRQAQQAPVLMVTREALLLRAGGESFEVMRLADIDTTPGMLLPPLAEAFARHVSLPGADDASAARLELNIMADRDIAYARLRRILATASAAGFGRLSLAVAQRPAGPDAGLGG